MGWCWRRCLSEEDVVDGDGDDIGYYPLCWGCFFFVILFWGAFFSLVAVGMVVVMMMMIMMNRKHICPHEMVFFLFPVIYIFCAANRFFFLSLPPKKLYV